MNTTTTYQISVRTADNEFLILPADSLASLVHQITAILMTDQAPVATFQAWLRANELAVAAMERSVAYAAGYGDQRLERDMWDAFHAYLDRRADNPTDLEVATFAADLLASDNTVTWQIHPSMPANTTATTTTARI